MNAYHTAIAKKIAADQADNAEFNRRVFTRQVLRAQARRAAKNERSFRKEQEAAMRLRNRRV